MNLFNEAASFLQPIVIETRAGTVTPYLEVIRYKGKYRLNSLSVNYSFGGLHSIFDQLFRKIRLGEYDFKNVLLLGMGAGSIINLLREKYAFDCAITAVEKDDVVIELARKYFNIDKYQSVKITNEDAYAYTSETLEKYDLIISDIFVEDNVPKQFAAKEYLENLRRISNNNCCVIYNKMTQSVAHKIEFFELSESFERVFPGSVVHKLYTHGSENSLLYYNTLAIPVKEEGYLTLKYDQIKAPGLPSFSPNFQDVSA